MSSLFIRGLKDIRIRLMYEINPFTGNSVSTNSRCYDDICKTGVYNHYMPIKAERKISHSLKEIEGTDILSLLLKDGKYKRAFRYMFEMGHPIPLKTVPKLLTALRGHRLSFYSLIDLKLSIFVVSNRTRNQITRLLIGPQGSHRIFLGAFKIYQLKFAERNAKIHYSRQIHDRYAKLMKEWNDDKLNIEYQFKTSEEDFVLNPSTGRLIKEGTHTYNRIFSKRGQGRPKKEDSLVNTEAPVMYKFQMLIQINLL